jgi:predicted nuclease of restriction endonuclease-like (RecB) superfamily
MQLDKQYIDTLENIKEKIRQAQYKAVIAVNSQLLELYWEIGNIIHTRESEEGWGAKVVELLSKDLRNEFPGKRGYSSRNLRYMRDFAKEYPDFSILQPVVAKLPWAHHLIILQKVKDFNLRQFYIQKAVENSWSKSVLQIQIESQLHQRLGNAITNFKTTLTSPDSDLAKETFKSPYVFNFLSIEEKMKERDFENALLKNITKFLLELGSGFAFVMQQAPIDVDDDEFFPDLIFYHIHLRRYIVIDLKMHDFKPEFAGKMSFYLSVFDDQWKTENDNPSIGLLLCKGAKKIIAEYALRHITQPIGVSTFLFKDEPLPEEFKNDLPSIEELETEIKYVIEEQKNWVDKKIEALKEQTKNSKKEQIQISRSPEVLKDLFHSFILPIFEPLLKELSKFNELFIEHKFIWHIQNSNNSKTESLESLADFISFGNKLENFNHLRGVIFHAAFKTYKAAGLIFFSIGEGFELKLNEYFYEIKLNEIKITKLYHQLLNNEETNFIKEEFIKIIISEIENRI